MDSGLVFSLGVAFGLLGGVGFILLLVCSDDYASAYFSERWHRLGVPRSAINPEAQETAVNSKEQVSQSPESQTASEQPRPACGSVGRGISLLLLAVLLGGCATTHGGSGEHTSVGGGVGDVHGATRSVRGVMSSSAPASKPSPTSPRTEDLPICGFAEPYLPEPCRLEVTPGEWMRVSNPHPKATKHHSWLWWLLLSLVTL
jgi:hypothetical protein